MAGVVESLARAVDDLAATTGFSGVVRADRDGAVLLAGAYGTADRGHRIPNALDTRFAIASGTKGFTALVVLGLVEEGRLRLDTTARSLLGDDLPLVDDRVTVEHLLAHRSGVGDYLDEEALGTATDYVLPVPVHRLASTEDYLAVLGGRPQVRAPGEGFAYNNSGYVVLALLAERATGAPFADLVRTRVCAPAGLADTAFVRTDEPFGDLALGYLGPEGPRTNVLHLPVLGSGDGGLSSTAADVHALWAALLAGRIVPAGVVADMIRPHSAWTATGTSYGLGVWLHRSGAVALEGADAGISFRSVHHPARGVTHTVLSNTTDGAWPLARHLHETLTS